LTLLSKKDLADIRFVAERAGGFGLNPHSTLKLLDAYEALVAERGDVSQLAAVREAVSELARDELRYTEAFWSMRARLFDKVCDLLGIEHHEHGASPAQNPGAGEKPEP
jgi:hypothetical protein